MELNLMSKNKQEEILRISENWDSKNLILIKEVFKIFKDKYTETVALKSFCLDIKKGEILAIMGPSGSGKSTLINIIAGLLNPTTGSVYFQDKHNEIKDLTMLSLNDLVIYRRDNVGIIFQEFELFNNLMVFENIEIPLLIKQDKGEADDSEITEQHGNNIKTEPKMSEEKYIPLEKMLTLRGTKYNKLKINSLIEFVGLKKRKVHLVKQLSGGEKQRVAICAAVIKNPPVILADEPTGELDSENAKNIFSLLKTICKRIGTTVIIASHDPLVKKYVDRIINIKDGQVVGSD
ncbi:MAG: ATP-binding cassette domain-containing protein [Candidatus Lokiarchaeota archaeon]|nr:ATP-binding cassette domain-containing protein [Candidatus Lokiarchaeota archaeon]